MVEEYNSAQQFPSDLNLRIRDLEEKIRLLKDRVILIGKNLVEEREKSFKDIQEMKKSLIIIQEDNLRMKELLSRVIEQLENAPRKEELMILQRQFDLFRKA